MALLTFIKFEPSDGGTIIHARNMKGKPVTMETTHDYDKCQAGLFKINQGEFIQDALPFMSADEREFMLSGMTPEEWEALFPEQ